MSKPQIIALIKIIYKGVVNLVNKIVYAIGFGNINIKQVPIKLPKIINNIFGISFLLFIYPIAPVYSLNLPNNTIRIPIANRQAPGTPPI